MSHVWRPLFIIIGIVVVGIVVRHFIVPRTFGIGERGYKYGWHDKANKAWWANFRVGYKGRKYCQECHPGHYKQIMASPHAIIECEDCHGPAINHPTDPPKLQIIKSRMLCLRCHTELPYPGSQRSQIPGFLDPNQHYPGVQCVSCHNPHSPVLGGA